MLTFLKFLIDGVSDTDICLVYNISIFIFKDLVMCCVSELGFAGVMENSLDGTGDRDFISKCLGL